MELVPLIYINHKKIHAENEGAEIFLDEILEQSSKESTIYILDEDGIENDEPNLNLYKKLSEQRNLWVDAGPRVLGDVVDIVMAGATSVTLRKNVWPKVDIPTLKEITESDMYLDVDLEKQAAHGPDYSVVQHVDGFVSFTPKKDRVADFTSTGFFKNVGRTYKLYVHEVDPKQYSYWTAVGVTGLLVDLGSLQEFKSNGL
jgi:uncharacterized protein related to proFAR isomerase